MKSEFEGKQRVPGTPPAADWFTKSYKTVTIEKNSAIINHIKKIFIEKEFIPSFSGKVHIKPTT